ncbi:inhibitor of nuclear factor kappa-B kinase subunit beta [Sitodiplosis mosellana]|uniref:inhibitor of nuclear factor kappa-B kinase subunit beta n=1 Tax=Sitodiplosis mosellana TaxID=263140 RepID=UPI00244375D4|nr:inhibitor of nuclear factor kappa-B kinase subunit beta [Sitodiplosis mosellana]
MLEHIPFLGDWHRSTELGCGAFAEVWVWQHAKSKEKIVVKTYRVLEGQNAEEHKERCNREVEMMTNNIRHVNIVRGLKVRPDNFLSELLKANPTGMPALITEYYEAGNLRRQLNDNRNSSGMLESEVRNILQSLKNALFYLHSLSKVHRDVKPENVVIHLTNDGQRIYKLTDLGCSKPKDFRNIEASLVSKMVYSAPELIISEKHSYSVDYWSMGMVIYEVITGTRPFVPHLPLAQWILRVRAKESKHITMYEDDAGKIVYSNEIYGENQISTMFSKLLETWFKLAFEWNKKQRGYVFERPTIATNSELADSPPVQVLKFFQSVDDILEKKILTIFVLTNYTYLSVVIDNNTTNDDLFAFIEQKAHIPTSQCHIIMAADLTKQFTKPIELYVDGCFDKPMVFVLQTGGIASLDKLIDDDPIAVELPASVRNVLANQEKRLKTQSLRKFACDTLHFVRNENQRYKTCLDGWFHFALQLNYDIEMCLQNVKQMQMLIYGVCGALDLYKQTLDLVQVRNANLEASWLDQHEKISQNIERLVEACDKITIRFGSVYRRIRETSNCDILLNRNTRDFYDIINATKAYDALCKQIMNNNTHPKPHFELFQCAYKCLKQRESLLRNKTFIEMQRNLNCIHIEFNEIKKALEKATVPAEKYRNELNEANKQLHEHAWFLVEKCLKPDMNTVSTSNSDLTLTTTSIPNGSVDPQATNEMMIEMRKVREMERQITKDHLKKTKLLIDDNINLRIKMADVMNEINEELKIKPN